ncbi:T9SS type A sorting domain-containing protein [Olleya sp. R77988]|uniref:T9SS type A sorting domain-containing protein n=1 Tax=Olleya sp. R77988 TaxID=3093875 RepID=UPI0037C58719
MLKTTLITLLFVFSISTTAQTTFGFENTSASGANPNNQFELQEIINGITMYSDAYNGVSPVLLSINSLGGFGGSSGNVIRTNPADKTEFTFDQAVDVQSIIALNGDDTANFTFTPIGGTNTSVVVPITGGSGQTVSLNWVGVTSFFVTSDHTGSISYFFDDVKVTSSTLSTTDFSIDEVSIFPNPATTQLNIKNVTNLKEVTIYDVLGKTVLQSTSLSINVEDLSKGVYIVKIETENETITKKVVKK